MKKMIILSLSLLFISPWIFRLSFENIMIAVPYTTIDQAKVIASCISALISFSVFVAAVMSGKFD